MNSSSWINLTLVLFLFFVLYEASADSGKWLDIVFRARQAEAKRNHRKYQPDSTGLHVYPGFILDQNMVDFLTPTLSNDEELTQTFTRIDGDFFNTCRKTDQTRVVKSPLWDTLDFLGVTRRGKPFFYSPTPRAKEHVEKKTFQLIQSPLSKWEKDYYKANYAYNLCNFSPTPGLKLVTEKTTFGGKNNVSYKYGADGKNSCNYFEMGLENMIPGNQLYENFNETFRDGNKWAVLYSLCYDKKNYVTAFTKHTINSQQLIHRKLNPHIDVRKHEKNYVPDDMDEFYDLDNQLKSLQSNASKREIAEFNKEKNYFVRARLVPEYDMLYESWQYAIHNYLNYAPQWRSVNLGQWLKVEQDIRNMAWKLQKNVTVYTGVYYKNNPPKLLIKETASTSKKKSTHKSLPIPSIFYKYVHTAMSGIVILTANGVSGSLDDIKCEDVCETYGWLLSSKKYAHRNQIETGLTKCCTPNDFYKQSNVKDFLPKQILTFGGHEVNAVSKPNQRPQIQGDTERTMISILPAVRGADLGNDYLIGENV